MPGATEALKWSLLTPASTTTVSKSGRGVEVDVEEEDEAFTAACMTEALVLSVTITGDTPQWRRAWAMAMAPGKPSVSVGGLCWLTQGKPVTMATDWTCGCRRADATA
jgi:hypothetical protein